MSSKTSIWLAFFLNLSYAIVEFIAGGIFGSSAVLADSVHDLGDAIAIGISALLETISNREEDRQYTLGYKRFSLLGAMLTAVILMIGSVLVILENITKIAHPQPVNENGILWLGIIAVVINVLASLVVRKGKTKNESILSLHFLEDTLGWLAVILMAIILRFTDWYILDPFLSLVISVFILSKAIPRFWSALKIFLDAVPEGVETSDLEKDLEALPNVKSINQLSIWSMDGLENNAIVHICIKDWEQMMETKEVVRQCLEERGVQNITIEVDSSQSNHAQHRRKVGKNGSGKTTIFHSILKFLDYQGEISLDGQEIRQETYARIGYLPEERSLMPKLTVLEQVRYLATLKGMDAKEVKEKLPQWMEKLEVKGKLTDKIKSLSKGNQQKIQLIITLIHEPDLIILDEPFSGLDPVNTELLKQVILKEKERGATIIFSDHVMTNVEELCDDILMIRDGRVVLHGPVQEVRNQYGKTRLFVSSERSKEELESLPHVKQVSLTKQGSWKLILDDESAGRELFPILTQGQYIATFDQQAPTIDEIFKLESGVEV